MTQGLLTVPTPPTGKLTYEDFLDWLDEVTHAEWVDGEIVLMSPVNVRHQKIGRFLIQLLAYVADKHRSGEVFYEMFQMKTGPDLPGRSPDVLFVSTENLDRLKSTYLDGPADLVIEIVSPDSHRRDRVEKFREYESGGVKEYWLIDPQQEHLELFVLAQDGQFYPASMDEEGSYQSRVAPDFRVKPEWLWQETLPSLASVLTNEA